MGLRATGQGERVVTSRNRLVIQNDDEAALFVVISDIDGRAHGPFHTREAALARAEEADGTGFRLVDDDEGGVK
jgi:hypothetical protein